ncbi:MAG: class I SAM-dependent methyltransferase, partial [Oscillospiraceae bacterium]|nr:class I SAM-dependent methyltransferase [Oscillospiraceae bacterium]
MILASDWGDYELLDCGDGEKLERWGPYVLSRPDPQAIWPRREGAGLWARRHAEYVRGPEGGGWSARGKMPGRWTVSYKGVRLIVEPTAFKHTGVFPEQAPNWDWARGLIIEALTRRAQVSVLNLFAYTGASTAFCASAGAGVCHVDASKGTVARAKENLAGNVRGGAAAANPGVRFIVDDVKKFVGREARRGNRYDCVIMDPPSYGRGPTGETWRLEDDICGLVGAAVGLLSDDPVFVLLNSYTAGLAPSVLGNVLRAPLSEGPHAGKAAAAAV